MTGSEAKGMAYASQMPVQGAFVRVGPEDHAEDVATEEPAAGRIAT
jgi:hypothetical protein